MESQTQSSPAARERNLIVRAAQIIHDGQSIHRFALSTKLGMTVTQYGILHPNLEFQLENEDKPSKTWTWLKS